MTEWVNHRLSIFTSAGAFVCHVGAEGYGDGRFLHPQGVALDGEDNIIVTDWKGHRVQFFARIVRINNSNNDGKENNTDSFQFAGKFGSQGKGDGQFNDVFGVAVNRQGQVIVADSGNHRIQLLHHSTS